MPNKFDLEQCLPKFKNPVVKELYYHDLSIDQQILKNIVELGEKVIPDLEAVLEDIIKHDKEYSEQDDFNWYTLTHALHLLGELRTEQSLPKILEVLKQDEDFLEFWFSDSLNEEMWEIIYKCGQYSFDLIEEFLKDQSNWLFSRTAVSSSLVQIALHHPDRQQEVIALFKRVIDTTISLVKYRGDKNDDPAKKSISWYVSDLMDLHDSSLKDYLLNLFNLRVVETDIVGPESINEESPFDEIKEIKSIYNRYDELERIYNRSQELELFSPFEITYPKVGRNDPCPCGSGKKWKKCHYLKQ